MSTYIISDIHGNLTQFKELLKAINFKFDGSDSLYLLGDYVDWGPNSIGVIKYVMELTEKYSFIHALIGNHDLMFLDQIKDYKILEKDKLCDEYGNINDFYLDGNWLYNNRGIDTFKNFLRLPQNEQDKIENFLDNLPYTVEITVNDKVYLAAHACPQPIVEKEYTEKFKMARHCAVWERITRKSFNVISWYNKRFDNGKKYENFICGHTISEVVKDGHFSIINIDNFIDIDCGAKLLGYYESPYEDFVRLAALRLDDFKEFYMK